MSGERVERDAVEGERAERAAHGAAAEAETKVRLRPRRGRQLGSITIRVMQPIAQRPAQLQ